MAGRSKISKTGAGPLLAGRAVVFEGNSARKRKVAIVVARWNSAVTEPLLAGSIAALEKRGCKASEIAVAWVPGAVEIPVTAKALAKTGRYAAVVALGCVIRGDTTHYDYVCSMAAQGVLDASLSTGVPVIFGVLTVENLEQALERAEIHRGNKGAEAAEAALEMADLLAKIGNVRGKKGTSK